jgi:hypothetical protein
MENNESTAPLRKPWHGGAPSNHALPLQGFS